MLSYEQTDIKRKRPKKENTHATNKHEMEKKKERKKERKKEMKTKETIHVRACVYVEN